MTKKRPWFQLHLSTCVVMMVVACALLWANLRLPQTDQRWLELGWPQPLLIGKDWIVLKELSISFDARELDIPWFLNGNILFHWVLPNLLVALGILVIIAFVAEWIIRKKKRLSDATPI